MKKNKTNITLSIIGIVTITFMLSSCGKIGQAKENEEIRPKPKEFLAVKLTNGSNWSIIDKDGNVVVEEVYPAHSAISNIYDSVYWVKDGKYWLVHLNQPMQSFMEEGFDDVADFRYCDYTCVSNRQQPIRVINTKGETIATLPENIKSCQIFSKDGYTIFQDKNRKYGVIDKDGNITIEASYANLAFLNAYEGILLTDAYQIIDTKGNKLGEIDRARYAFMNFGSGDGKLMVSDANTRNGKCHVLNLKGEDLFTINASVAFASYYVDGYAVIMDGYSKWGVVDDKGDVVVRPRYDQLINLGKGEFIAELNRKCGVINAKDEIVIGFDYSEFDFEKLGDNFVMKRGNKYILVNKAGEELSTFSKCAQDYDSSVSYIGG